MWDKINMAKLLIELYNSKTKKKIPYRKGKHSKYAPTITKIIHYNLTEILPEEIAGIPFETEDFCITVIKEYKGGETV